MARPVQALARRTVRAQSRLMILAGGAAVALLSGERTDAQASVRPGALVIVAASLVISALPLSRKGRATIHTTTVPFCLRDWSGLAFLKAICRRRPDPHAHDAVPRQQSVGSETPGGHVSAVMVVSGMVRYSADGSGRVGLI